MPEETERGKDIARDCFASLAKTKVRRTAINLFGSDSQLITSLRGAQRRGNLSGADKISLLPSAYSVFRPIDFSNLLEYSARRWRCHRPMRKL